MTSPKNVEKSPLEQLIAKAGVEALELLVYLSFETIRSSSLTMRAGPPVPGCEPLVVVSTFCMIGRNQSSNDHHIAVVWHEDASGPMDPLFCRAIPTCGPLTGPMAETRIKTMPDLRSRRCGGTNSHPPCKSAGLSMR